MKVKLMKPWGGYAAGQTIDPMPSLAAHLVEVEYAVYTECPACPLVETMAHAPGETAVMPDNKPKRGRPKKAEPEPEPEAVSEV